MIKKILLGLLGLIIIGGGALFFIKGKDNYDASKYSANVSNGLNSGSTISFTLPDQFDKSHTLQADTKTLVLVFAKATGHTVKEFLKKQDSDYLAKRATLFVADISPMPTVIRNTFALPDLKKSAYSVLLIYDKNIAKQLKNEKEADKIAVVTLENGVVNAVKYIDSEEELEAILK
ncbi:hypothetical protein ACLHDG_04385 [Sulfurovum sp. CS9]|uniref:hypothetical protein n=1 Tax=Sulfurovum sp. CS9 TaxID=3391146 RepID=UPI0039EB04C0